MITANNVRISQDDVKTYDKQGFLVVDNVMSDLNCVLLRELSEPHADDDYSVVLNIHKTSGFCQVMKDPVIVKIVETLQKSTVVGLNSQYLFKNANTTYGRQSWTPHQDNSYPKAAHGAYIIAHLSLEASDPGNGGLIFWPSSHVEEILEFENRKSWREDADEQGITHPGQTVRGIPPQYTPTDMYLARGSLCLMHGNLIHGSHPNLSGHRDRPQYSMAYLRKGEPFERGTTSVKQVVELH